MNDFNNITDIDTLIDAVSEKAGRLIEETFEQIDAEQLGLDPRAGYDININEYYLAVAKFDRQRLDYYGGFEYVDPKCVTELGEFVFYSRSDERVNEAITNYESECVY